MNKTKRKLCPICNESIVGRTDKRFCSSYCRASFHNQLNKEATGYMSGINGILRKNRRILMKLNAGSNNKITKEKLLEEGYKFNYHTNEYSTKSGKKYYFCYEQGYCETEPGLFTLVVRHDYVL